MGDSTHQAAEAGMDPAEEFLSSDSGEAERIAQLEAECATMKDRLLRTLAEMDNLRKRTEREVADAKAYALTSFARDILPVADNLGRALAAVPEEALAQDSGLQALAEGVAMTERELLNILQKNGVSKLDPQGEKFDPNLHQAIAELEDVTVASGTVLQVMQAGYVLSGRVLRPAMVVTSKGGARPSPAGSADGAGVDRLA